MNDSKLFHQYQLHRPLGGGWLGPVYAATDLDESAEVALRIVDENNSGQSFLIMQLERLLLKVNSLRHPNILPTEPLQQRDHRAFYAMNLAAAGSLRQVLQRQGRSGGGVPLVVAVEIMRQAAAGLAYAHAQGLMHGDLKPENLLLQPGRSLLGNTGYNVQLSDFGLAELRVGLNGTHDRAVVNTLAYTSPEQCRGIRNELRTDIYTLGLILYELVTGMVPFDIRDAADALEKHQHVAPKQPSLLRSDLPEDLEEIILTCLAKNPADRYESADELEGALQQVLNTMMPSGPEPTIRLPTLPVLPAAPTIDAPSTNGQLKLLVYNERHGLEREVWLKGGAVTIGRAPDNTVILEHAGVSRHHLNVEFTAGMPYVTELTATNGTLMDGLPLTSMTRLRWPYRTPLYLRPYWLAIVGPEEKQTKSRIVVKPEVEQIKLVPGQPYHLNVLLANTGQIVDHFQVSVDGIPPEWVQNPYGEVQLNPGTQASTTLILLAPRESKSRAGEYPATVLARSREDTSMYGRAPVNITVAPFREVVATITPPVRKTWRRTTFTFKLENRSNTDGVFAPRLQDREGQIRVIPRIQDLIHLDQMGQMTGGVTPSVKALDPTQVAREAARQAAYEARARGLSAARRALMGEGRIKVENLAAVVPLKAGETSSEPMQVRVPIRWVGLSTQHPFTIDVFDNEDEKEDASPITHASAELHHTPLIPLWLFPILLLLIGILIWWLTRPPAINQFDMVGSGTDVIPGQPFQLHWDTSNAYRVRIPELAANGQGLSRDGTVKVAGITQDQKYTLEARNLIGTLRTRTVVISPKFAKPVIEVFTVNPPRVAGNQSVTVTWQVKNATSVNIAGIGNVKASGKQSFKPSRDMNVQIVAKNGTESASDSVQISVAGAQIKEFKVTPEKITRGQSAVLSWNVVDATSVTIDGIGPVSAQGKKTVSPQQTTTYAITALGGNNTSTPATAQLQVTAAKPVITSFSISPNQVRSDKQFTISWNTQNATSVTLQTGSGGATTVGPYGKQSFPAPPADSEIVITATNDQNESVTASRQLGVTPYDAAAEAQRQQEIQRQKDLQAQKDREKQQQLQQEQDKERQAEQEQNNRIQLIEFTATPEQIQGKGDVTLQWKAPGWTTVRLYQKFGNRWVKLNGPTEYGAFAAEGTFPVKNVNTTREFVLQLDLRPTKTNRKPVKNIFRTVKVIPIPAQVRSFTVSPSSLNAAGPVTLTWDVANADAIRLQGIAGPLQNGLWPAKGKTTVNVNRPTTFTLLVGNQQSQAKVDVNVPDPVIASFSASPTVLSAAGPVTLTWNVRNVNAIKIDGLRGPNIDGSWPANSRTTVNVAADRTFILRAGSQQSQVRVNVNIPDPIIQTFNASPLTLNAAGAVTLSWNVQNASAVKIDGLRGPNSDGSWPANSRTTVNVAKTRSFVLRVGNQQRTVTVTVLPPAAIAIRRFDANRTQLDAPGGQVTLSWDVAHAKQVQISGVTGPRAGGTWDPVGSTTVNVNKNTTFTLTAGPQQRVVRVFVNAPVAPPPSGGGIVTPPPNPNPNPNPNAPARIIRFFVSPKTVKPGTMATLRWEVEGVTSVTIDGLPGTWVAKGGTSIRPQVTTTYVLHAGNQTASATITVTGDNGNADNGNGNLENNP